MTRRRFGAFACLDWSGAKGLRQPGIAVACCTSGNEPPCLVGTAGAWSRASVLGWLREQARAGADLLVGVDFSAALPFVDRDAYFPGLAGSPTDAHGLWALIDRVAAGEPNLGAALLVDEPGFSPHFRRHGGRTGAMFGAGAGRMRMTERACRAQRLGAAQSGFNLVGPAQVGKASLTGMRLLHQLRGQVPVWPFDPVPAKGPLMVEIYTTIAARAAGVAPGRSKLRDGSTLDAALHRLGSARHAPLARYDDHVTDALIAAAWLRTRAGNAALWRPAGLDPRIARTEGWTFGVP